MLDNAPRKDVRLGRRHETTIPGLGQCPERIVDTIVGDILQPADIAESFPVVRQGFGRKFLANQRRERIE
jgi:hypothetical protein